MFSRDRNVPAKVDQFEFSSEGDFLNINTLSDVSANQVDLNLFVKNVNEISQKVGNAPYSPVRLIYEQCMLTLSVILTFINDLNKV